jgi:HNH endonuclease
VVTRTGLISRRPSGLRVRFAPGPHQFIEMKITLQSPYSNDWRLGYIVRNGERRRTVILYNSSKNRSSVSYARYLMACYLGRYLEPWEVVDHIDNNEFNDRIENLQILTRSQNILKSSKGPTMAELNCYTCNISFLRERRQVHNKNRSFCGRPCFIKYLSS